MKQALQTWMCAEASRAPKAL